MHQQCTNDTKILNYSSCHGPDKDRFTQMNAVLCTILCAGSPKKHSSSIGQRHLWTFKALGALKSDCLTGAHTTRRGVQNQRLCPVLVSSPVMPFVTCKGTRPFLPGMLPQEGMAFRPFIAQLKPIRVATASVSSPSLRKEIHFISANLAVEFRNQRSPQISVGFQKKQNDPPPDYESTNTFHW